MEQKIEPPPTFMSSCFQLHSDNAYEISKKLSGCERKQKLLKGDKVV